MGIMYAMISHAYSPSDMSPHAMLPPVPSCSPQPKPSGHILSWTQPFALVISFSNTLAKSISLTFLSAVNGKPCAMTLPLLFRNLAITLWRMARQSFGRLSFFAGQVGSYLTEYTESMFSEMSFKAMFVDYGGQCLRDCQGWAVGFGVEAERLYFELLELARRSGGDEVDNN